MPGYMEQLLQELGWQEGTRVPLANEENKKLETVLISRQKEIQRLKEATTQQQQKQVDLDKYRHNVTTEVQENTKLLLAQKQQLDATIEACEERRRLRANIEREAAHAARECGDVHDRTQRMQNEVTRLLKLADGLKSEVCGERGALEEWRAAIDRSAADIGAIEVFNKQDLTKAKALETRRCQLKCERDRMHERLMQVCSNLAADERAAETLSDRVNEAREERTRIMMTWAAAVDNMRQRDKDIRHTKEDYAVLEEEGEQLAEQCREKQQFAEQLAADNEESERECQHLGQRLSRLRRDNTARHEQNVQLLTHITTLQRVLSNMQRVLNELRAKNRHIHEEQRRFDDANRALTLKLKELREKKLETLDKTKSAAARAKELENMLAEEKKYTHTLMLSQQRAMQCSFNQRQKLLALQSKEKLARIALRRIKDSMFQLDGRQQQVERELMMQKETLYNVSYQVETIGSRVAHMEGATVERQCDATLVAKEKRLEEVCALHMARVALLSTHSDKLKDEMRRLSRDIGRQAQRLEHLHDGVRSRTVGAEGQRAALREARETLRRSRVEESLMKLRVAHASRAVANLDNTAFTLHAQRLQMDAAMNERRVEVEARLEMFSVQKRSITEDCGQLNSDIRERQMRIEQLKKRYDIFIASLGKDDSGQQLSVTFFKIKFASERAELRARGAELDADIARCESEVAALEATLQVMHAAHTHFVHNVSPLRPDDEEMKQLAELGDEYYSLHDALVKLRERLAQQNELVMQLRAQYTLILDKQQELRARHAEAESEWEEARERLARQEVQLQNACEVVRAHRRRVRKLLPDQDSWKLFIMELRCRDYTEATYSALRALGAACAGAPDVASRFAELAASKELVRKLPKQQRRNLSLLKKLISGRPLVDCVCRDQSRVSVMSPSSVSTSCSTQLSRATLGWCEPRGPPCVATFRTALAEKTGEKTLVDNELPYSASRSTAALSVVTLGLEIAPVREMPSHRADSRPRPKHGSTT